MANVIEITDFSAPALDVYARLTEAQLLNRFEPAKGMFIAESPKVIHRALDGGYEPVMQNNFYQVDYKGKTGWVNAAYVVRNTLEIVLMESNVPAYVAPDRNAKKVGSLSKMTR